MSDEPKDQRTSDAMDPNWGEIHELTPAQWRLYNDLREHGDEEVSERRRATIDALVGMGLVYELTGGYLRLSEVGRMARELPGRRVQRFVEKKEGCDHDEPVDQRSADDQTLGGPGGPSAVPQGRDRSTHATGDSDVEPAGGPKEAGASPSWMTGEPENLWRVAREFCEDWGLDNAEVRTDLVRLLEETRAIDRQRRERDRDPTEEATVTDLGVLRTLNGALQKTMFAQRAELALLRKVAEAAREKHREYTEVLLGDGHRDRALGGALADFDAWKEKKL